MKTSDVRIRAIAGTSAKSWITVIWKKNENTLFFRTAALKKNKRTLLEVYNIFRLIIWLQKQPSLWCVLKWNKCKATFLTSRKCRVNVSLHLNFYAMDSGFQVPINSGIFVSGTWIQDSNH